VRARVTQNGITVQAIVGNHAAFLGFDLDPAARPGCLGFGIHRTDHTEQEAYWVAGFKTFRSVVPEPSPDRFYPTEAHPIQSMWWGDYTAKPAHRYTYRIVPMYGSPAAPAPRHGTAASIDVTTSDPAVGTHGVYFNRGVAASQAYSAKFGAEPPDLPADKRAEAMAWLSRGLHEAIVDFIVRDAAPGLAIRAAAYEFTEPAVLAAFGQARAAGADVRVLYHDKPDDPQSALNQAAITAAGLDPSILISRRHPTIAHNKFIVRATKAADGTLAGQQVWTGSTNFSQGGVFGHSNVGHAVRDAATADAYLAYWTELATDPTGHPLKTWVSANNPFDLATATSPGIHALFSPRVELAPLDWYAAQFANSPSPTFITLPFGLDDKHFEPAVAAMAADAALRFVMLNVKDDHQASWSANHAIKVAVGATGGPDSLSRWAKESLTGFNEFVDFLHTKILLVGPLDAAPVTISGSANFSAASTTSNDENMLVVVGDTEVADVYFTEYARIFEHFYARWWASRLGTAGAGVHSYLAEDDGWQAPYWNPHSPKSRERDLYANQVANPA
jgi:phosphatidylserine/phosphatidylglycerophosphate/cardiolipin synthase-like enzyme